MIMNREITISYRGKQPFILAMKTASISEYDNDKQLTTMGYSIADNRMYLFAYQNHDELPITAFPYPMDIAQTTEFVWGWLEHSKPTAPEPDIDGSICKGWTISSEFEGKWSNWGCYLMVEPSWREYHK